MTRSHQRDREPLERWLADHGLRDAPGDRLCSLLLASDVVGIEVGRAYRVLAVQQPWAWAIIHAGMDVIGAPSVIDYRGPLLIQPMGAELPGDAPAVEVKKLESLLRDLYGAHLAVPSWFGGRCVGLVEVVGCSAASHSPWALRAPAQLELARPREILVGPRIPVMPGIRTWRAVEEQTKSGRKGRMAPVSLPDLDPERIQPPLVGPIDEAWARQFLRVVTGSSGGALDVGVVDWTGPNSAELYWRRVVRWRQAPAPAELMAIQREALEDGRFFGICQLCAQRCPRGHMHSPNVCSECAEEHMGVIH